MISKLTKKILRLVAQDLNASHSPYEHMLLRADTAEVTQVRVDFDRLTSTYFEELLAKELAPPTTALKKFEAPDWEYMNLHCTPTNEAPAVRRLYIGGGHLYQVAFESNTGKWHPPLFVPDKPQLTAQQIEEMIAAARRV